MNWPPASTSSMRARISSCSGSSGVFVSNRGTDMARHPGRRKFRRVAAFHLPAVDSGRNATMLRRTLATAAAAICLTLAAAGAAAAEPTWAPAATAPVHPGVQTFTNGAQCTSNFVFSDASNTVYLGQAAHCAGTGGNTATDGCTSGTLPVGTPVEVSGASQPGTLAYSSWATMQANGESDPDTCQYNDISLIQLDPADAARTNPSVPFWGGPTGLATTTATGDKVLSYGNSELRLGISQLSPKE